MLALMSSRRFAPLFWTQFLSAFNDNFLKNAIVFFILFKLAGEYVTIKGRAKRFAEIGGEMVSFAAVEELASQCWPAALSVAAALPDPRKGQRLVLLTQEEGANRAAFQRFRKRRRRRPDGSFGGAGGGSPAALRLRQTRFCGCYKTCRVAMRPHF